MHIIIIKFLPSLKDKYVYQTLRFLQVLFFIAIPFSFGMAAVGTLVLHFGENDAFFRTLLVYTASHVSGNYLGLYTYYVLRGLERQVPPKAYLRDLCIVCAVEVLLNVWKGYGDFRQAATVQIYPLLAYIAARYNQCYTALADVFVIIIVLVSVVLKRGPYYTASTATLSLFISLFIMLMYSACLTALLSFFMQQRRTALDNVSSLKDELLLVSSQVGHDVRAPLTHIISVCENLQTAAYTAEDLEEVGFSCQTIVDIMDSWLIMLSDSESRKDDIDADENTNNWTSTAETLTMLLRKVAVYGNRVIVLSKKNLTLRIIQPDSQHTLQFSNKMLQHVLINLVSNSIKYSNKGEISITVVFERTQDRLCVTVRDEGIGIASEHLPHLFDQFYRIRDNKVQKLEGNTVASFGVGLAIVKSLITKMQGSIAVSSEMGIGTEFRITIPCHDVTALCNDAEDEENQNSTIVAQDLCTLRVLLVEDNRLLSSLLARQLFECASVKIIADGALVMDAIRECDHDVILLDGSLPNLTGQEILTHVLQDIGTLSLIPVIVTISGGDTLLVTTDWKPLIVEHCNKPFTRLQLLAAITKALRRQQFSREFLARRRSSI